MPSERIQRRIDHLLDQAEEAADRRDWPETAQLAREALTLDADNQDARVLVASAQDMLGEGGDVAAADAATPPSPATQPETPPSSALA